MNICWESADSLLLLNSRHAESEKERFQIIVQEAHQWPGHLWLSTSGSSAPKWVGLSKQAVLASAEAVNRHLESGKEDRWINALPICHVGGLSIWARAHLSGATVYDFKQAHPGRWCPEAFYAFVQQAQGTLTSLVPAQVHDLAALGRLAPPTLRAVIVGGGPLLPLLYERATALGWPLLPSYGLTECASQVATASLASWRLGGFPALKLLPHIRGSEREGRLCFAGPSLLSAYAYLEDRQVHFADPKVEGWLLSEDRGRLQNQEIEFLGRADTVVKIGGENVDLAHLEARLQTLRLQGDIAPEVVLIALPDPRLGSQIHLVSNSPDRAVLDPLIHQFQQSVLPFERIQKLFLVPKIPRSPLGKILGEELRTCLHGWNHLDSSSFQAG